MTPKFISPAQIFPNSSLVHPTVSGVPPLGRLNRCLIFNMSLTKFLIPPRKFALSVVSFSLQKMSPPSFLFLKSKILVSSSSLSNHTSDPSDTS